MVVKQMVFDLYYTPKATPRGMGGGGGGGGPGLKGGGTIT